MKTPVLTKVDPQYAAVPAESPPPYTATNESGLLEQLVTTRGSNATNIIASSPRVRDFLQHSLHLAVDNLFKSGTVEQLMGDAVDQVTSFNCTSRGSYGEDGSKIKNVDVLGDERFGT